MSLTVHKTNENWQNTVQMKIDKYKSLTVQGEILYK
jgi:hypothetical protein